MQTKVNWCSVFNSFLCSILEISIENIKKMFGQNDFESIISDFLNKIFFLPLMYFEEKNYFKSSVKQFFFKLRFLISFKAKLSLFFSKILDLIFKTGLSKLLCYAKLQDGTQKKQLKIKHQRTFINFWAFLLLFSLVSNFKKKFQGCRSMYGKK